MQVAVIGMKGGVGASLGWREVTDVTGLRHLASVPYSADSVLDALVFPRTASVTA